jgi:hypothetical protein
VLVKVQGPRPENILFLIHEVYETMIMESFHGVTYDYFMPCQDCVKAVSPLSKPQVLCQSRKSSLKATSPLSKP